MLSIGMIPTAELLGKKYYQDSLSLFEGYIPVFKKVPNSILEYGIQEDESTLKPCVLSFKKELIGNLIKQGIVKLPAFIKGSWQIINIADGDFGEVELLLIPAPIALSEVSHAIFKNASDQEVFNDRIEDSINGLSLKSKVSANEFKTKNPHTIDSYKNTGLFAQDLPAPVALNYHKANAITAVINHLMILSNSDKKAAELFGYIKEGKHNFNIEDKDDHLLLDVGQWVRTFGKPAVYSRTGSAFIELCENLITYKNDTRFASSKDIVLFTLEQLSGNSEQTQIFIEDLKNYLRFANHSVEQLLGKYSRTLQRALILFISRDEVLDLWQRIGIRQSHLGSMEMILATLLFAVSRGWQGLMTEFKDYGGNHNVVIMQKLLTELTKNICIESGNTDITDLYMPLEGVWQGNYKGKIKEVVIAWIKHHQLDCAEDEIVLPEGIQLIARGGKIIAKTKVQTAKIHTVIDEQRFLDYLSSFDWFDFEQDRLLQTLIGKK